MKTYRGPSVDAGVDAAGAVADEEKLFAVCRRRKVRPCIRGSNGLRGPPVFLRFVRQASFGSPRVSFETIQTFFIFVCSYVVWLF